MLVNMDGNASRAMRLSFHDHRLQDQFQLYINMLEIMAVRFAFSQITAVTGVMLGVVGLVDVSKGG